MTATMASHAVLSQDGLYRYQLTRIWDHGLTRVTWVMLNPSTADASVDDPTIRRCMGYARGWGFGGITVVNLYGFRATDPKALLTAADPVGPDNDQYLADAAEMADFFGAPLVAGWGANAQPGRVGTVLSLPYFDRLTALGVTKAGQPRHPLYLRSDAELTPWPERTAA